MWDVGAALAIADVTMADDGVLRWSQRSGMGRNGTRASDVSEEVDAAQGAWHRAQH